MINAIILAGGKSSRMPSFKALQKIMGKPIIEIVIGKLQKFSSKIIVVTNDISGYETYDVTLVEDIIRDKGPLAGLYSGLTASDRSYNFVVGCDMPFLNINLIKYMVENSGGNDVVVPRIKDFIEPLHGVYLKSCLPFIKEELDRNNTSVKSFFNHVKVKYISEDEVVRFDPGFYSFFNINTQEDLVKARSLRNKI